MHPTTFTSIPGAQVTIVTIDWLVGACSIAVVLSAYIVVIAVDFSEHTSGTRVAGIRSAKIYVITYILISSQFNYYHLLLLTRDRGEDTSASLSVTILIGAEIVIIANYSLIDASTSGSVARIFCAFVSIITVCPSIYTVASGVAGM